MPKLLLAVQIQTRANPELQVASRRPQCHSHMRWARRRGCRGQRSPCAYMSYDYPNPDVRYLDLSPTPATPCPQPGSTVNSLCCRVCEPPRFAPRCLGFTVETTRVLVGRGTRNPFGLSFSRAGSVITCHPSALQRETIEVGLIPFSTRLSKGIQQVR